ncbi:BatD family protein [Salibacter halophilus]|uniref:Protein BatD n=1 Tax=Salibacter halophilus TaxID=1803916 RepID=A0A6N6M6H4_9FLAO|nr:hypothetical protein [Salibacter halophilus]KAB1065502.1 hypothetical protein F3059_02280 [Salibacter halophilus]
MRIILTISLLLSFISLSFGQSVEVNPYSNSIQIGEQIKVDLKVESAKNTEVIWPQLGENLHEKVMIVNSAGRDTVLTNNTKTITEQLTVTGFDTGVWAIEPIAFVIDKDTFRSEPFLIEVQDVEVDTSQAIKDIQPIREVPYTFEEIIKFVGIGAGALWVLISVVSLILYLTGKDKKRAEAKPQKPLDPPHVEAFRDLTELKDQKLWQNEKHREFHIRLSEIIRSYLERRFGMHALEYTTSEIEAQMHLTNAGEDYNDSLIKALRISDMAKFAKAKPLPNENEFAFEAVESFVEVTKPVEEEKNEKENGQ